LVLRVIELLAHFDPIGIRKPTKTIDAGLTSQPTARELLNQANPHLGLPVDANEEPGAHPDRLNDLAPQTLRLIPDKNAASLLSHHLGIPSSEPVSAGPLAVPVDAMVPGRGAQARVAYERNTHKVRALLELANPFDDLGQDLFVPTDGTLLKNHLERKIPM